MAERTERVVLVPRFTSFVGVRTFVSQPMSVRRFVSAWLTAWRSDGIGSPSVQVAVEQSTDLLSWYSAGTAAQPAANDEDSEQLNFDADWMRVVVTVGGTDPAVTVWAVGDFVAREQRAA